MKFQCLGTGSDGNCYLVNLGGGYIILDAGLPIKRICSKVNLNDVDFAFVSHIHNDHYLSYKDLVSRGVKTINGVTISKIVKSSTKSKFGLEYKIIVFPVEHDDVNCCGIVIQTADECILYVTDFTNCKPNLSKFKFTSVIVECNYMKENAITGKFVRSKENIYRHLSLEGCDMFLSQLDLSNCKELILVHFSNDYSNPIFMASYISQKYKIKTYACKKHGGYDIYE